jgi:hypothetical protein
VNAEALVKKSSFALLFAHNGTGFIPEAVLRIWEAQILQLFPYAFEYVDEQASSGWCDIICLRYSNNTILWYRCRFFKRPLPKWQTFPSASIGCDGPTNLRTNL